MTIRNMCFDKILPSEVNRPMRMMMIGGRLHAVFEFRKRWINGSTLTVLFMGGTQAQQELVIQQANLWTQHANLNFDFNNAPNADIRISFDPLDGAWSYVGTDARQVPQNEATMNLGFLDGGTAIHEFGHAIGLGHEHQNPDSGIQWNEAEVISDLSGPPNNWTEAETRHNVLDKYAQDQVRGTNFDPDSIMLYEFPDSWTLNNGGTHGNSTLSNLDKEFIESAVAYPGRGLPTAEAVELDVIVTSGTVADIGVSGEEDVFTFNVNNDGRHVIETSGNTDVVMKLFGPDSQTLLIAEDDDGGEGTNSRIAADLSTGKYFVQVRHFNRTGGTGSYSIRVTA